MMDFEKVNAAIGQMDGRFPVRIAMKGKVDSPDKVKYAEEGGKPTQQVWITDGPGIRNRVKIDGNFPDLTRMDLEQLLDFKICGYKSKHDGKIYYKGWCDVPDDRQGPTTEPTPNTRYDYKPKGGQQPAADKPDWDSINLGKCRDGKYNAVIRSGCDPITLSQDRKLLLACEFLAHKSMHGIKMTDAEKFQMEQDLMVDDQKQTYGV